MVALCIVNATMLMMNKDEYVTTARVNDIVRYLPCFYRSEVLINTTLHVLFSS